MMNAQLANAEANIDKLWNLVDSMKRIEHRPEPREPGIVTKFLKKLF